MDRKSARIKPFDIAKHLVAFANANGGILVIRIEDDGTKTGFKCEGAKDINDFLEIPYTTCLGNLKCTYEIKETENDKILVFFIDPSEDTVIKTTDGKVYLRVGDKSKLLNHEQVTQLEYDKGERSSEWIYLLHIKK